VISLSRQKGEVADGDNEGDPYDHGGNYWMSSAYLIRWNGPVDESQDAYGDSSTPPGLTAAKHVQEIRYLPGGASVTDTSDIKYALTTYGAVATSIRWQSSASPHGVVGSSARGGRRDSRGGVAVDASDRI
jgi:C1A family cysteine protease